MEKLNHLDYLPPLEHARPSTALQFPGCRQIAAYRAGTGFYPRAHLVQVILGGPRFSSFLSETARNNKNEIAHTTVGRTWKKWSVVPVRAPFAAIRVLPLL